MRFQCSHCQAILDIEDCDPGELVQCGQCQNAVTAPLTPTSPGALIGDFIVKRELGSGGMGNVFLAHQATLDRDVAIKILRPDFAADAAFIESFIREARAAAAVNHPNIVQAYAVNSDQGLFYFAMEYIDGPTLKQSLAEQGRLPAAQVIAIAEDMVAALGFAWRERKIVHRDIKPDNIMMANTGHAKLADLGLARKITETNPDGSSELFGTPQYIAPELLFGYSPDARSDIYSLGCTLYHLLSGQCPFDGETPEQIVNQHLFSPMRPLLEVAPDAPPGLAAMIALMMAKRPAQRYPDYDLIAADLKAVKAGRMPAHNAAPTAQQPIDGNSDEPFAIPDGEEAILSGEATEQTPKKKKRSFSSTPKVATATPILPGAPMPSSSHENDDEHQPEQDADPAGKGADATEGEEASEDGFDSAPENGNPRRKNAILFGGGALLLLAIAAAAWFVFAGKDTTDEAASAPTPNPLAKVQSLIKQQEPAATIVDELNLLAATMTPGQSVYHEFLNIAAPYVEKDLAQARQKDIAAEQERWQGIAQQAREEAERRAAEDAKKTEEAKKAEEEAQRQAEAEAIAKRRQERLDEQKNTLREQMLEKANAMDFSGARILFSPMLASSDNAAKNWAQLWTDTLNDADKYYKMIRNSRNKLAGTAVPVLGEKSKWQIDSIIYDKVTLKHKRQVFKDGQDQMLELQETLDLDQLLYPQLEDINHKLAELESLDVLQISQLCVKFLLVRGAYLPHIAHTMQKFGVAQELQDEVAALNGQHYMQKQLEFLRKITKKQAEALLTLLKNSDPEAFAAIADEVAQIIGEK